MTKLRVGQVWVSGSDKFRIFRLTEDKVFYETNDKDDGWYTMTGRDRATEELHNGTIFHLDRVVEFKRMYKKIKHGKPKRSSTQILRTV